MYLYTSALTVPGAVVPVPPLLLGHVELRAQAVALLRRRLEEQDGKLPHAAPLAADQLRGPETHLLHAAALGAWGQNTDRSESHAVQRKG